MKKGIIIKNLTKIFLINNNSKIVAVDNVNLEIETVRNLMSISTIFLICMLTGLSILIMKLAGYASKKKTKSIEDLIGSITAAQHGDLKSFVTIQSNDEFEVIGEHFNKMLVEVHALMKKNDELNDRNRVSQIKQLESQFNPHFIFNTLETLKYLLLVDEKKASEMIVNFANILRYSIDYEKNTISLVEDIKYLNSYLMIQKCRYNKRLTYDIHIDEEAKQCIVPKLIMQPIIENCINHSYKGKDTLHIDVNIKVVGESSNGKDGVEVITELKPDIVITDIKMPFMDGLQMLEAIENRDFGTVIITGYGHRKINL